ncbi:abnormal spindle-like microcephaly-associated protein homolog [Erythrolamprus reginae]|uniref:abnormal spindle-like microcephaly-associated protein homolog n=1 Tax=Erythrolamprus reginae TaxID=121349 RepID=UPI00396CA82D
METYEDHPWCSYNYPSGEEEMTDEEVHPHDRQLAKVRARSNSRSRRSFLVDELDMLMDKAATTIQATWRGHLTRKQLMTEQAAASTIQAAWRRYIAREYHTMQRQVPSPQVYRRRRSSSISLEREGQSWGYSGMDRERAAQIIQAHYRGYMTRQALAECQQAATTIQANWRGYRARRDLTRAGRRTYHTGRPQKTYYSPPRFPTGTYYGHPSYMPGSSSWVGPYPRKHWRKCLVGDPEEWKSKVPRSPSFVVQQEDTEPSQPKTCPRCGRCTSIRVLVGVGKGPPSETETEDSECDRHANVSPSRSPRRVSYTSRQEAPTYSQSRRYGPRVYQAPSKTYHTPAEEQTRRQSREPSVVASQRLTPGAQTSVRLTRERTNIRSLSSTSVQPQQLQQPGMPSQGTSDWLYENYGARRMGEGQRRVFKTRKQMWQVVRAATLIQAFWRGWRVRQTLRLQEEAAIKIQSAYRGYRTRAYLMEVGIISEGETD